MQVKPLAAIRGIATFLPGAMRFACGGSGGTDSARYCYATWMRHWQHLRAANVSTGAPAIAELGPGDSLGIGLAAMLSGTDRYFALDALPHARTAANLQTLDRLVEMFERSAAVPGSEEFPEIWPPIAGTQFPRDLHPMVGPERVAAIRQAIVHGRSGNVEIRYFAPWHDANVVQPESVDLILSQAVLEHVEDIDATYDALFRWLKPGGVMSHQIDFRSHSLTRDWYGHWTLSPFLWRIVKGRRPYLINRLPLSAHTDGLRRHGFEILKELPQRSDPPLRSDLAEEFRSLTDEDLRTSALYVIARKPLRTASR